jgi:integrase
VTLRAIFDCAAKHGWINQERIPKITTKVGRVNSRPGFNLDEEGALLATADAWADAAPNKKIRAIRKLTTDYATILFATGMRPGEALKLKWRDIEPFTSPDGRRNQRIWVGDGKTGRRDPIIRSHGEVTIMAMMMERRADLKRPDQPIFVTPDGTSVVNFATPFERWLQFAGLLTNPRGEKRTIYSCRHTYITWALAEGLSTHIVSKQVDTSTPMMDRHYSKVSSSMNASLLSGRTRLR